MTVNPPASVHVALLRGVNAGRGQRIGMARLVEILALAGVQSPRTYLQSGNVLFNASTSQVERTRTTIERSIASELGLTVSVLVRSAAEIAAVARNSLLPHREDDPQRYLVAFLSGPPDPDRVRAITPPGYLGAEFEISGREIHLWCPAGVRMTDLTQGLWERDLGLTATTRNWNTVRRLAELTR
jgi:uncharacterized protein (DUF1697 family)